MYIVFDDSLVSIDVNCALGEAQIACQEVHVEAGIATGWNDFFGKERAVEMDRAARYGLEIQIVLAQVCDNDASRLGYANLLFFEVKKGRSESSDGNRIVILREFIIIRVDICRVNFFALLIIIPGMILNRTMIIRIIICKRANNVK